MNLTVGFIVLFLVLFLPGIIFRRFYYLGEFSKQISPDEPILNTLTYSLIPSSVIQLTGYLVYINFVSSLEITSLIDIYKDLINENKFPTESKSIISHENLVHFITYQIGIYTFAMISASVSYLLVRGLGLDKRFKLLRFNNQWAYIFSAEVLHFDKFKRRKIPAKNRYLFPYVDVMVRKNENETELYSGVVTDYELNPKNNSELDKIYLTDTKRFKKSNGVYEQKNIPGEFFILLGKEIINININYIIDNKDVEKSKKKYQQQILIGYNYFLLAIIFVSLPIFLFNLYPVSGEILGKSLDLSFIMRLGLWYGLNLCYSILFPFIKDTDKRFIFIGIRKFIATTLINLIVVLIILSLIYIFL